MLASRFHTEAFLCYRYMPMIAIMCQTERSFASISSAALALFLGLSPQDSHGFREDLFEADCATTFRGILVNLRWTYVVDRLRQLVRSRQYPEYLKIAQPSRWDLADGLLETIWECQVKTRSKAGIFTCLGRCSLKYLPVI